MGRLRRLLGIAPPRAADDGDELYGVGWLGRRLPGRLPAGRVFPVALTLRNTGALHWQSQPPDGRSVDLVVRVDGELVATHKLPRGITAPGETLHVRFALAAPTTAGPVTLRFELVRQQVAFFADRGVAPLEHVLHVEPAAGSSAAHAAAGHASHRDQYAAAADVDDPTDALWSVAVARDPWHYQPTRGVARGCDGHRYPVFVERSRGCRLWDSSGREYLDYVMGWGSILLGYGHQAVDAALKAAIDLTAPVVPYPHRLEIEVAERLCEDIPSAEMAIFGKNGSDVCSLAARTARVLTGRYTILFAGYHGWQDWWVEQLGFARTGVPERERPLVHRFRFNDRADFDRLYAQHRGDLAAVFIEPAGPWEGDDVGWGGDADAAFLAHLAERTRAAGALLVFDEIVTGYRYPGGSVQAATGVTPDMTCLGKALASGMPLSALVGRGDVFREGLPRTAYGPTFKGEVYSFAAARAALDVYRHEPVAAHVWDQGTRLVAGLERLVRELGLDARVTGPPFRSALVFADADADRLPSKKALYVQELLRRGLSTYNGIMLPSFAHDDTTLAQTLDVLGAALEVVADAERDGDFERRLEIPPLVDL